MPRLPLSSNGATPHERLIGHSPAILRQWLDLESAFFSSTTFDAELREQVRRALAMGNLCEYCMAKGGPPNRTHAEERVAVATAFAEMAGADHRSIGEAHIEMLREHFSDAEVAELVAFVSFISASQMFGAMMGLQASDLPRSSIRS